MRDGHGGGKKKRKQGNKGLRRGFLLSADREQDVTETKEIEIDPFAAYD